MVFSGCTADKDKKTTGQELQEQKKNKVAEIKDDEYGYGKVVEIAGELVVLSEKDVRKDKELIVSYVIHENTKFRDIRSIKGIKKGMTLEINYDVRDGKNIAKFVCLEDERPAKDSLLEEGEGEEISEDTEETLTVEDE